LSPPTYKNCQQASPSLTLKKVSFNPLNRMTGDNDIAEEDENEG